MCDCGNEIEFPVPQVLSNSDLYKSCRKCDLALGPAQKLRSKNPQLTSWKSRFTNKIINRGRAKNIKVSISIDDYIKICSKPCFYCGAKPKRYNLQEVVSHHIKHFSKTDIEKYTIFCNGADRIDNRKGYELSNIVSCCRDCNFIKYTKSNKEFYKMVKDIYNYRIKNDS